MDRAGQRVGGVIVTVQRPLELRTATKSPPPTATTTLVFVLSGKKSSFLGFFNKVAAFLGPALYFFMAVMYDSRAGIFSIAFLLLLGALLLYRVDIDAGIEDAKAEDERIRKLLAAASEEDYDSMHN